METFVEFLAFLEILIIFWCIRLLLQFLESFPDLHLSQCFWGESLQAGTNLENRALGTQALWFVFL